MIDREFGTLALQKVLNKYGLSGIMEYPIIWNDYISKRNWGVKDNKPIHLDGGTFGGVKMIDTYSNKKDLSDPEFVKIYEESKKLKKEFGDTDENIAFSKEKEIDDLNEMKDILREYSNQGYSLSDVKEIMKDEFGEDYVGEEPTIEQAYHELTTTSIKNKTTARERAERGLDPVVVEAKRSFGEVWDNAHKMIDDGEVTPSVLASVIANKPRALSAEESAILLKDRMDISQEYGMKTEQLLVL